MVNVVDATLFRPLPVSVQSVKGVTYHIY